MEVSEITQSLSLELFEDEIFGSARLMSIVYAVNAAFESSVRRFVFRVLIDTHGENWREECVSAKIRAFAEGRGDEEDKTKWHGTRSEDLLRYRVEAPVRHQLPELGRLSPYLRRQEWAASKFAVRERSRNVFMRSGGVELSDVERIGTNTRDWY